MPVNYGESYRQLEMEVSAILAQQNTPQAIQMGIENGNLESEWLSLIDL